MQRLTQVARCCFGLGFVAFGMEYLVFGRFLQGLPVVPLWLPGSPVAPRVAGVALLLAGAGIVTRRYARTSATLLGLLLLACALLLHLPSLALHVRNPGKWTTGAEALSLAGGALVLARSLGAGRGDGRALALLTSRGHVLFALPLTAIGAQHFLYARFVATLVPAWLPAHYFFAIFTGAALVAAALAITFDLKARLAATLLGIMLLSWVLVLHLPRIAANPRLVDEWTSGCVAFTLGWAAFIVAAARSR